MRVTTDVASLRSGFDGQILQPGDDGYDESRRIWNGMIDRHPAVIARCTAAADVAAAVRFGRSGGLEIAVRGGGHGVAGYAVPEGGLMVDLSPMNKVRVDADRRRAWVLRGGGGNFGVVTEFEFRLHRVGAATMTADLFFTPEAAPRALRRWRDLLPEAPRQATFTASAVTAGDLPFVPLELQGKAMVSIGFVWIGDPEQGQKLLPALREAGPVAERIRPLTYVELQQVDDNPQGHGRSRYWKSHYLRELGDDAIDAFVSRGDPTGEIDAALLASGDLQAWGGEIASTGHDESAFSHRDALVEFVARNGG